MELSRIGGLPAPPDGQDGNQPHSAPRGETGLGCNGNVWGLYRILGVHLLHPWGCFWTGSITDPRSTWFPAGNLGQWFGRALTLVVLGWCHPAGTGVGPPDHRFSFRYEW